MLNTELCSCGSGLRQVRCCATDMGALPGPEALAALDEMGTQATQLFNEKKHKEAEALALKLLDLAPNHRLPLRVLFEIRKAENKLPAAEALARRLADLPAANAGLASAAHLQLAQLIIGQGRFAEAEPAARKALIATPREATVQHVMGVVFTETGRLAAGERHYRKALAQLGREDGMVLGNLAWNLKLQGRLDEAAAIYERALALRPDNSRAVGGYAQAEMGRGHPARAKVLLDGGLQRWPNDRTLRLLRALTDLATGDAPAVLARLSDPAEALLPAELAARGQALARLNQPAEAVSAYAQGKKLQRERYLHSYAPEDFIEKSKTYKAYFTGDRLQSIPRAVFAPGLMPVFVLGFPRSGTSLLEQLLAQVKGIAAGDDLAPVSGLAELVPALSGGAKYPEALDDAMVGDGMDLPAELRRRYLAARAPLGQADFFTDRSPDNAWHLGLIKLLFPDAPVLHVIRHPFDIMLSNLSQDRKLEANCGVSLPALARHYDLTMSMIRHYRGQLTLRYLPVRYEDLIAAPEAMLNRVLAFIGAAGRGPPDATLRENNAPPPAIVPSHYTVREKLHARGLFRYRGYQALMPGLFNEVRPVLKPWIDELGYQDVQ